MTTRKTSGLKKLGKKVKKEGDRPTSDKVTSTVHTKGDKEVTLKEVAEA